MKSSVTLCEKNKKYNVKSENTQTPFKTFNHSPDLFRHQQTPKPSSIHLCSWIVDQREVVHTQVPTSNVTKQNKPSHYQQWKAIGFMQPVCLHLSKPTFNPLILRILKQNYRSCATTIKTTDLCMFICLCMCGIHGLFSTADTLGFVW